MNTKYFGQINCIDLLPTKLEFKSYIESSIEQLFYQMLHSHWYNLRRRHYQPANVRQNKKKGFFREGEREQT